MLISITITTEIYREGWGRGGAPFPTPSREGGGQERGGGNRGKREGGREGGGREGGMEGGRASERKGGRVKCMVSRFPAFMTNAGLQKCTRIVRTMR